MCVCECVWLNAIVWHFIAWPRHISRALYSFVSLFFFCVIIFRRTRANLCKAPFLRLVNYYIFRFAFTVSFCRNSLVGKLLVGIFSWRIIRFFYKLILSQTFISRLYYHRTKGSFFDDKRTGMVYCTKIDGFPLICCIQNIFVVLLLAEFYLRFVRKVQRKRGFVFCKYCPLDWERNTKKPCKQVSTSFN